MLRTDSTQALTSAQDPRTTYFAQTTMFTLKRSRSTGKDCAKQGQQTSGAQGLESLFRLCYMDGWPSTPQPASSPLHSCFSPAEQSDRGRFCDGCLGMDDGCSFDGRPTDLHEGFPPPWFPPLLPTCEGSIASSWRKSIRPNRAKFSIIGFTWSARFA